jgi:hypothetical protein
MRLAMFGITVFRSHTHMPAFFPTFRFATRLDHAVAASLLATLALNLVVVAQQVQADPAAPPAPALFAPRQA